MTNKKLNAVSNVLLPTFIMHVHVALQVSLHEADGEIRIAVKMYMAAKTANTGNDSIYIYIYTDHACIHLCILHSAKEYRRKH